jgi:predicted nucleic acid-binding protein
MEPLNSMLEPVIEEDSEEDKILEAAVAGNPDCIVLGDSHLLQLERHRETPIHNTNKFLEKNKQKVKLDV